MSSTWEAFQSPFAQAQRGFLKGFRLEVYPPNIQCWYECWYEFVPYSLLFLLEFITPIETP